jgi:hypothetical protein
MRDPQKLRFLAENLSSARAKQEVLWQRWCEVAEGLEALRRTLTQLASN